MTNLSQFLPDYYRMCQQFGFEPNNLKHIMRAWKVFKRQITYN